MQRRFILLFGTVVVAATAYSVWWCAHHWFSLSLMHPAGHVALAERTVMFWTVGLSSLVIFPVYGLLFAFAWRYRDDNPHAPARHAGAWDHPGITEAVYWAIPAVIIMILSYVAWRSTYELDPYRAQSDAPTLRVQVVALDWKWLFIYPDLGVASLNTLVIPHGTPVRLMLTADAPMNSFWVPKLAGQIMVMPGMSTELHVDAQDVGTYPCYSANLSGKGFSGMECSVRALSTDQFTAWVSVAKTEGVPLDEPTYALLAKPSSYEAPRTFAPVHDGLYSQIIATYMTPMDESISPTQHLMHAAH